MLGTIYFFYCNSLSVSKVANYFQHEDRKQAYVSLENDRSLLLHRQAPLRQMQEESPIIPLQGTGHGSDTLPAMFQSIL